jgi:1-acyl-sn-glycerol-3-phosphate acyltransferase
MRSIKLIAILSLGLFFFGVLALVHLWISVLRLPNRWKIVSRWMRGFTRSMRAIINIKVTVEGDAGQLERGGYVIISNHFGYLDGIVSRKPFPGHFCFKTGSEKLAGGWSVDDTLRHRFYQSAKQGPDSAGG